MYVCVCVCVCVCVYVCMYVCMNERERDREIECEWVRAGSCVKYTPSQTNVSVTAYDRIFDQYSFV